MVSKLKDLIKLYLLKVKWKQINKHNTTKINRLCNLDNIKVGKGTYGPLHIYDWGVENEGLIIGNYVSISENVKFLLGGNHRYDILSTYPFKVMICDQKMESYSNGKIVINDDVWIGINCTIMSGVTIGKGAIIAAGSVVTKDVDEYSIVGGNPAKLIKYRFNEEIIREIKKIDFNKIDDEFIKENINLIYSPIDKNIINRIFEEIDLK